jgi:hypothetical protein
MSKQPLVKTTRLPALRRPVNLSASAAGSIIFDRISTNLFWLLSSYGYGFRCQKNSWKAGKLGCLKAQRLRRFRPPGFPAFQPPSYKRIA